jgi:hypothetical protein
LVWMCAGGASSCPPYKCLRTFLHKSLLYLPQVRTNFLVGHVRVFGQRLWTVTVGKLSVDIHLACTCICVYVHADLRHTNVSMNFLFVFVLAYLRLTGLLTTHEQSVSSKKGLPNIAMRTSGIRNVAMTFYWFFWACMYSVSRDGDI